MERADRLGFAYPLANFHAHLARENPRRPPYRQTRPSRSSQSPSGISKLMLTTRRVASKNPLRAIPPWLSVRILGASNLLGQESSLRRRFSSSRMARIVTHVTVFGLL